MKQQLEKMCRNFNELHCLKAQDCNLEVMRSKTCYKPYNHKEHEGKFDKRYHAAYKR